MSLIYGLNAQIGVYLAADTRLTTKLSSDSIMIEDDFGKFHSFSEFMHVVAAGDASLASFLVQKIQNSELGNFSFNKFKEKIVNFVKNEIGFYPYIDSASSVVFIFAGSDPDQREVVNMDKLSEYTKLMQAGSPSPVHANISKPFSEAMHRAAEKRGKAKILELDSPFTGLFSLEIIFNNGLDIKLSDAEWSTYLMYGPNNLTAKDAPPELVIDIDIGGKSNDLSYEDILYENSLTLVDFFKLKMIPKHKLNTVGGSIITFWVVKDGAIFVTGEVGIRNSDGTVDRNVSHIIVNDGEICTQIGGDVKPLRKLIDFFKDDRQMASAFI